MTTRYVVLNEHTLGYFHEGSPSMGVLAGKVLKGGYDWKNGPVTIAPGIDTLRPATKADFDDYRVSSAGHLSEYGEADAPPLDDDPGISRYRG